MHSTGCVQIYVLAPIPWLGRRPSVAVKARSAARPPGDAAGARDRFAALLPIHERALGPEHPNTLTAHHDLASWTEKTEEAAPGAN
jgi:hypothetical protein